MLAVPLVIFPPWINRFYILDLTPEKSFIRWCLDQGISVFMVSWKSADASMKDVVWDDYVTAQVDAVDVIRTLLDVPAVHAIGYCVAGTTLAATLALLAARGEADKMASATFFTAQVDFARAGELSHFISEEQLQFLARLSPEGFLDGRYMAATFNLLRGRDLIWNYVTNNYLLGKDYVPFDLLHWNGDTTNLPAKWHKSYLTDLYRDPCLRPGRAGGSHRPRRERVGDHPPLPRAVALRARRIGPYRRRGEPARGGQISVLDQRPACRHARRVSRRGHRDQGQLVAALAAVAARTGCCHCRRGRRAHPGRGHATCARRGAGPLRPRAMK